MDERILKYLKKELSLEEKKQLLEEVREDDKLKFELQQYCQIDNLYDLHPLLKNIQEGAKQYHIFESQKLHVSKRTTFFSLRAIMAVSAVSLLLIAGTWWLTYSTLVLHEQTRQEIYVPPGQRAQVTLSDGTTVWLNANTRLVYPTAFDGERRVELSGEGYFDVKSDPKNPFIVVGNQVNVTALGTSFNVCDYIDKSEASVFLVEGKVQVVAPQADTDEATLSPDQQLSLVNGKIRLLNNSDKSALLWRQGLYSFTDEPLESIADKLALYFDVRIIIEDEMLAQKRFTGKFRTNDGVMEILRMMRRATPFSIVRNKEHTEIILSLKGVNK